MIFSEKLQLLRRNKGFTQEELAEKLNVSRQAVAKWEAGQVYPDIMNLIELSNLLNVTIDYLVKDQECIMNPGAEEASDLDELISFRLEANRNTYAAFMNETDSTRLDSHDFRYENGQYTYHDTYVGGEQFSGNFLKEALRAADPDMPYRGPEYYQSGEYTYKSKVSGDFTWFQGYEEIFWVNKKVYECYFHGGIMR